MWMMPDLEWVTPVFNPRIPYGMQHALDNPGVDGILFQSTHPVWDATYRV